MYFNTVLAHTKPKKYQLEKVDTERLLNVIADIEVSRPSRKMWALEELGKEWFKYYAKEATIAAAVEKANTGALKKIVGHCHHKKTLTVAFQQGF